MQTPFRPSFQLIIVSSWARCLRDYDRMETVHGELCMPERESERSRGVYRWEKLGAHQSECSFFPLINRVLILLAYLKSHSDWLKGCMTILVQTFADVVRRLRHSPVVASHLGHNIWHSCQTSVVFQLMKKHSGWSCKLLHRKTERFRMFVNNFVGFYSKLCRQSSDQVVYIHTSGVHRMLLRVVTSEWCF